MKSRRGWPCKQMIRLSKKKAGEILDKLSLLLQKKAGKLDEEDVHHIRTNSRKAETLLDTLPARQIKRSRLAQELRKLRKRAGDVRDADVQIGLLQGLAASDPVAAEQKRYLLDALHMQRLLGQRRLEKFLKGNTAKIRRRLRNLPDSFPKPQSASSLEETFESDDNATLREALRRFQDLRREYPALHPGNLHDFRKRGKHIRYLAEMGKQTPQARHFVEQLTAMQDAIGSWHDWQTLRLLAFDLGMHRDLMALILLLEDMERRKYAEAIQVAGNVAENVAAILRGKPLPRKKPQSVKPEKPAAMSSLA